MSKKKVFSLLVVVIVACSLFYGAFRAFATSAFDGNYRTADYIQVNGPTPLGTCPILNNSSNWYSEFITATPAETHFIPSATLSSYQQVLQNNVTNGVGSWGVSTTLDLQGRELYTIMFSAVDGAVIDFENVNTRLTRANNQNDLYYISIKNKRWETGSGPCEWYATSFGRATSLVLSNADFNAGQSIKNAFYGGNFQVNYPVGYAGKSIRSIYNPPNTYYPDFLYTVDGLRLSAYYTDNIPFDQPQLTSLRWRVVQKVLGQYTNVVMDVTQDENDLLEYQFPELGEYEIWLDYVIAPPGQLTPPDTVETMVQRVNVDGSTYNGDTAQNECNSGVCQPPSVYEDCGTYGANLVGGIGCHFRNFGTFLRGVLTNLFVPRSGFIGNYFSDLSAFFTNKFGLLAFPVTFLYSFLNQLVTAAASPTCSVQTPGTFFGAETPALDFCTIENAMPTVWNGFIAFVRGATVFVVVMALYRKFMNLLRGAKEESQ